jgi:hypothetical protein
MVNHLWAWDSQPQQNTPNERKDAQLPTIARVCVGEVGKDQEPVKSMSCPILGDEGSFSWVGSIPPAMRSTDPSSLFPFWWHTLAMLSFSNPGRSKCATWQFYIVHSSDGTNCSDHWITFDIITLAGVRARLQSHICCRSSNTLTQKLEWTRLPGRIQNACQPTSSPPKLKGSGILVVVGVLRSLDMLPWDQEGE